MIRPRSTPPPGLDALLRALDVAGLAMGSRETQRLQRAFELQPGQDETEGDLLLRLLEAALVHSPAERELLEEVYRPWAERWARWEQRGRVEPIAIEGRELSTIERSKPRSRKRLWVAVSALVVVLVGFMLAIFSPREKPTKIMVVPPPPPSQVPRTEDRIETYDGWLEVLPQLLLGSLVLIGAGALGWRYRFHPWRPEVKPVPSPVGPLRLPLLPLASAGPELLDQEGAQAMVWGVGKHVAEELTSRIDLGETAHRTAAAGGVPTICYEPDQRLREVWLWLDGTVDDPALGRYCEEIAASLERVGLPVRLGFFDGYPLELTWDEGQVFRPQELEGHRQTALVAICTDGEVLLRYLADVRGERVRPLLRALAGWPRLALVDFSKGSALASTASRFGIACIAPEGLPKFFGLGVETAPARPPAEPGELQTWAAALALSPRPVERTAAHALRRALGLGISPWDFHRLLEIEGAQLLGGQLSWEAPLRRRLVHWLEESEGCDGDGVPGGSVLEKALAFWETRLETEEKERLGRSELEASGSATAQRHLRMEHELLRLWRDPKLAIEGLWGLRGDDVGTVLMEKMGALTPWDCPDREEASLRLPWRLAGIRDPELRFRLAELGLGGVGKGALRPPGRLVMGVGFLIGLGVMLIIGGL